MQKSAVKLKPDLFVKEECLVRHLTSSIRATCAWTMLALLQQLVLDAYLYVVDENLRLEQIMHFRHRNNSSSTTAPTIHILLEQTRFMATWFPPGEEAEQEDTTAPVMFPNTSVDALYQFSSQYLPHLEGFLYDTIDEQPGASRYPNPLA